MLKWKPLPALYSRVAQWKQGCATYAYDIVSICLRCLLLVFDSQPTSTSTRNFKSQPNLALAKIWPCRHLTPVGVSKDIVTPWAAGPLAAASVPLMLPRPPTSVGLSNRPPGAP